MLVGSGSVSSSAKEPDLSKRCSDVCHKVWCEVARVIAPKKNLTAVCYEMPHEIGHVASARGDVIKLSILCGALSSYFSTKASMIVPVRIVDWKGQLSKDETKRRVNRAMGWQDSKKLSHEYDAIGIGLYKLGKF